MNPMRASVKPSSASRRASASVNSLRTNGGFLRTTSTPCAITTRPWSSTIHGPERCSGALTGAPVSAAAGAASASAASPAATQDETRTIPTRPFRLNVQCAASVPRSARYSTLCAPLRRHPRRTLLDGLADARIGPAPADVAQLIEVGVGDRAPPRGVHVIDERDRGHDLAGLAVAALRDVHLEPRLLHRVQLLADRRRQPLDRGDVVGRPDVADRRAARGGGPAGGL